MSTEAPPCRIIIVGGGTAAWLAALMLSHRLAGTTKRSVPPLAEITVVESSKIPTIGVGEGTTAVFGQMLQRLGLDEQEFLAQTGATIKFGIKHRDWRCIGHTYDGPIDDPHAVTGVPAQGARDGLGLPSYATGPHPWLDIAAVAAGQSVSRHHLFHYLLNLNKCPVAQLRDGRAVRIGPFQHAYHFDQARVGAWLAGKAKNVRRVDATVARVELDEQGQITTLVATDGQRITGDFFIDCTGFRRRLMGEALNTRWISYRDALPVNRAMPFWLEHDRAAKLPSYTQAWAQGAGWMWSIPTQERMGCGYVYDDRHLTPEQAQAEIEQVLGRGIEPRSDLQFDCGRLENSWVGNCLALGLTSSFLEPLEATSIHGTVVQLMLLTQRHLTFEPGLNFVNSDGFNANVAKQVDDFRDFINLHYVSERRDTPFWQAMSEQGILPVNRERLAVWQQRMPRRDDFAHLPDGLPHIEEQLYYPVLDGLGLLQANTAKALLAENPVERSRSRKLVKQLAREYRQAASRALDHREYLRRSKRVEEPNRAP